MNTNYVKTGIIAVVALVIVTAFAVPILGGYTSETATYHNTGQYFAEPDGAVHVIEVVPADKTMVIDGIPAAYPDMRYGSATLAFGEDTAAWILRLESNGRLVYAGPNQIWRVVGSGPATITIDADGNISATVGGTTTTHDGVTMHVSNAGTHVMAANPYITDETMVYAPISARFATGDDVDLFELVSGTADDLTAEACRFIASGFDPDQQTIAVSTFTVDKSHTHGDLYRVDSINQHVESEAGAIKDVTITLFVVPEIIEYDNPDYAGGSVSALIGLMPLMLAIAVIIGIVGTIALRRND